MLVEKQTPDLLTCPPAELSQDGGTREQTQPFPSGEEILKNKQKKTKKKKSNLNCEGGQMFSG